MEFLNKFKKGHILDREFIDNLEYICKEFKEAMIRVRDRDQFVQMVNKEKIQLM